MATTATELIIAYLICVKTLDTPTRVYVKRPAADQANLKSATARRDALNTAV